MSDLSDLRDGIQTVVETAISGLRVYAYPTEGQLEFPCLVLDTVPEVRYGEEIGGNTLVAEITATLYAFAAGMDQAWATMDGYRSPTGATSIRAAIRTDRTLDGKADDADVERSWDARVDRNNQGSVWQFSCRFDIHVAKS